MKTWNKIAFAMLVLALIVVATAEEKKADPKTAEEDAEALKRHRKMANPPSHCADADVPAGADPAHAYYCHGVCVNVWNDTMNCGSCGHRCHGAAPNCTAGVCIH